MSMKKKVLAVTVGASLLVPSFGAISAHEHGDAPAPTVETDAVELRSTLDHYLSEHVFLAVEAMRKGADGAEDFEAAANALNANTEDLSAAIASVYGDEAGEQFQGMWEDHIGFFVDYVMATAEDDEEGRQQALDELAEYRTEFSQFLESATDERLEAESLADGLQMHVDQLIGAFDSYVAGDFETAYEYEREAMHHMYMVSKGLSTAITDQFEDDFNGETPATAAGDLRSDLNYLLSEHAGLAVVAMQNGIDGADDFEASAQALNNNTEDLSAAIASVFGEEAGNQFEQMWADHIGHFVSYVEATGAEDEEAQEEALAMLDEYRAEFSEFLDTATEGRVAADGLSQGLQEHVNQLIGSFDSYVAGDYEAAYADAREAYGHMFMPAKGLSGAFVDQFPEEFAHDMPSDMPETGLAPADQGGMSATMLTMMVVGLFAVMAASGIMLTKVNRKNA
ncbi:hypothetical protein [Halalkalibacillus halophilus]|uniref:hypothetical protein n=1 Tax=Halalkalibacillus halophilus TaxID=392827 RepID=UPI0003F971E9|nr:hypothetical protein [Halalkalibacillus halophilus]